MVMGCHAFESNYEAGSPVVRFVGEVLHYGNAGVDLFFVLLGFLITGILYDSLKDEGYFRKFYAVRVLRIFPLYYGVLFVCLLLTWPLHLHWGSMRWMLMLYLQNLRPAGITNFSPGATSGFITSGHWLWRSSSIWFGLRSCFSCTASEVCCA